MFDFQLRASDTRLLNPPQFPFPAEALHFQRVTRSYVSLPRAIGVIWIFTYQQIGNIIIVYISCNRNRPSEPFPFSFLRPIHNSDVFKIIADARYKPNSIGLPLTEGNITTGISIKGRNACHTRSSHL